MRSIAQRQKSISGSTPACRCNICYMATLNLRGISQELHQALKVRAAAESVSIQSLCVRFMWQGLEYEATVDKMSFGTAGHNSTRVGVGSQPKPAPKSSGFESRPSGPDGGSLVREGRATARVKTERIATGAAGKALASRAVKVLLEKRPHLNPVCPSCGALNGMHFRGCKA